MERTMSSKQTKLMCLLAGLLVCGTVGADTYTDNFSGASAALKWTALNDACLTAGDGSGGTIPACGKSMIATPDGLGAGALRLTPATTNQTGAILSNFTFPSNQGLQVTFTTYTYGGSADGTASNGADGISFLLTDGTATAPTVAGGLGGSMGYSCSNGNGTYEGLANAYLGLGIDEYGNFLNAGDNTSTGVYNTNNKANGSTANGANSWAASNVNNTAVSAGSGPQYQPERIGLRGAGNLTWAALKKLNSTYYSGTASQSKVQAACKSGTYVTDSQGNKTAALPAYMNYAVLPGGYKVLPDGTKTDSNNKIIAAQPIASNGASNHNDTKAWPITYKLVLSSSGLLNFSYSYNNGAFQQVLANSNITSSNGTVPSLFRFGFSAGTGGSDNVHEITCFQATPLQSNSSAGANTVQSGEVRTTTQIYLASYSTDNWWGSLTANSLATVSGALTVSNIATWDTKCVLTGGACTSMGTDSKGNATNTISVQGPTARVLLTADSSKTTSPGIALQYKSLNSDQQTTLNTFNGKTDSSGASRIAWLRGDRTVEQLQTPPGTLRARNAVMGDIINSSPTFVGAPTGGTYPDAFSDFLYGKVATAPENLTGAQAYSAFVSSYGQRQNVVYVGSNDGLLHGFRAGLYDSNGYNATTNDGKEVIGFMPQGALKQYAVDLSNPLYGHDYVVDATPAVGDVYYNGKWHTWLVGGVGSGGAEIYALDVTDPSTFSEGNASTLVIGDWTSASTGLGNLGNTVGTPVFARMHNNQWAVIFGNGLGSTASAGVYIGLIDSTSGAVTYKFIDTGVGNSTTPNGIAYVSTADLDGDHIADYLYAGDLQGNVWRIDVTSNASTSWAISSYNGSKAPLFVAKDGSGTLQPITTAVNVAAVQTGSDNRVMVFVGTGQKTPFTANSADVYAKGVQTLYGIWDWNMSTWNTASTVDYTSLSANQTVVRKALLSQAIVNQSSTGNGQAVLGYRTLPTGTQVCWQGSSTCATNNTQYGWYFDFPDSQEQVIYNPAIIDGAVVVSTAEPPVISAQKCSVGLQSGWTMAFDPASGGGLAQNFFPDANGSFSNSSGSSVGGIRLDAVGTPTAVMYNGQSYLVTQTVKGVPALTQINPPASNASSRVSWREIKL